MDLTLAALAAMAIATAPPAPADTVIEYAKAYYQRLTIHRWASDTMLPLFAAQYYVGSRLHSGDGDGDTAAHEMLAAGGGSDASAHRAVAICSMAVFTVGWLIVTDLFRKD